MAIFGISLYSFSPKTIFLTLFTLSAHPVLDILKLSMANVIPSSELSDTGTLICALRDSGYMSEARPVSNAKHLEQNIYIPQSG